MATLLTTLFHELDELSELVCGDKAQKKSPYIFPRLCFFYDPRRHKEPLAIIKAMPEGCGFIFRHFGNEFIISQAFSLRREAQSRGVFFSVGQDIKLANLIHADGLHVPWWDRKSLDNFTNKQSAFLISASAHNLKELTALAYPPSMVFWSPVFESQSQSAINKKFGGVDSLIEARSQWTHGLAALGGIDKTNILSLKGLGLSGVGIGSLKDKHGHFVDL